MKYVKYTLVSHFPKFFFNVQLFGNKKTFDEKASFESHFYTKMK
jgi:hypothetical protein